MNDLIQKYFQSELTEAEEKALAERLASSIEASERFATEAKRAYLSFGLPHPGGPGIGAKLSHSPWAKILSVAVVAGSVAVAHWWPKPPAPVLKVVSQAAIATPAGVGTPVPSPPAPKTEAVAAPVPQETLPPRPEAALPALPAPGNEKYEIRPQPAGPLPGFNNLQVVVDQVQSGPVTVRILGPDGTEVRRLYSGILGAGRWAFTWDGVLAPHQAARRGVYRIEVMGEGTSMSKEVAIH
jgi:hypothetical protein